MRERTEGRGFATRAIHAGERPDPVTHAHRTPIYATATYTFDTAAEKEEAVDRALAWEPDVYFYSRTGNPTNRALEAKVASLEGAEDAVVSSSGMASVSATLLAHLASGDHIVAGQELFAITDVLLDQDFPKRGIGVTRVDPTDLAAIETAITPATRLIFVECATNPRLRVPDLDALAAIAGRHDLLLVADNTFLGPALLRPLEHGADLVLHAATKYLSGHGDAVSGVVAGRKALVDPIRRQTDTLGQAASPFSSFLVQRGIRTLPLRSFAASANAARIAAFLDGHDKVGWVRYPGLASHPDHAVARRLLGERFGGMVTFKPRGGLEAMAAFTDHLRLCDIGVSLGDIHTLVYPRPKDGGIIRLSIGCEDIDDLLEDVALGLSFVA
ncbi:MAG TPA: PLP-dependent aspartate aminotransferase family protein [Candidatus Limnocylindrales bacterium]|jgi:cystathionine beta-lyase/cystathionine gamma-synthase|nr:PLP-dependent aspartate aminotransferase family protein [Candidatus Limnocylindrales bacterium]